MRYPEDLTPLLRSYTINTAANTYNYIMTMNSTVAFTIAATLIVV